MSRDTLRMESAPVTQITGVKSLEILDDCSQTIVTLDSFGAEVRLCLSRHAYFRLQAILDKNDWVFRCQPVERVVGFPKTGDKSSKNKIVT
jgi:hypothetical protein